MVALLLRRLGGGSIYKIYKYIHYLQSLTPVLFTTDIQDSVMKNYQNLFTKFLFNQGLGNLYGKIIISKFSGLELTVASWNYDKSIPTSFH